MIAKSVKTPIDRQDTVSDVRLIQVDFATRDDRADIGWVFGTFMFDSEQKASNVGQVLSLHPTLV